jgi:Zn-dependent protease
MIRFKLFGIPVQVQPWFWVSLVLIAPGGIMANTKESLLGLALFVLAGLVSILVHEMGHALAGRACGAHSEVTLHAFGGVAEFSGVWLSRKQNFFVTAAGPGVQLVLGVAVWLLFPALVGVGEAVWQFWWWLAVISIFWALLNLLPVLPLDGGQMLNALLGPARVRLTLGISIVTAVGVAMLMVLKTGMLMFPVFLVYFAFQAWKALGQSSPWR